MGNVAAVVVIGPFETVRQTSVLGADVERFYEGVAPADMVFAIVAVAEGRVDSEALTEMCGVVPGEYGKHRVRVVQEPDAWVFDQYEFTHYIGGIPVQDVLSDLRALVADERCLVWYSPDF